ncbi:choice-of-anchor D domain-containing protein [Lujinxingia sediminis]|nr:choice-of-anchor D domain-containing protein [Lujinxingia sediminis]
MKRPSPSYLRDGKNLLLLALALLFVVGTTACGEDSISSGDPAAFSLNPNPISFQQIALGEESAETIVIGNSGDGPLRITSIEILQSGSASIDAFYPGNKWPEGTLEVAPNSEYDFQLIYRPEQPITYGGILRLVTNDTSVGNQGTVDVNIRTQGLNPEIFSPPTISFPRVPAGQEEWKLAQVANIGQAPLLIDDIVMGGNSEFRVSFPGARDGDGVLPPPEQDTTDFPSELAPDESFEMRVWFNPATDDPTTGEITIYSNDPSRGEFRINLNGNSGSACIAVTDEDGIDFNIASLDRATNRTITISNCSPGSALNVSEISLNDDGGGTFSLRPESLPELPITLLPRESSNFVLTYTPTEVSTHEGELRILSDDPAKSVLEIPLMGQGSDSVCPIAVATATIQGSNRYQTELAASPLETIQLNGSDSSDPDGTNITYEWSVISRPVGSLSQLQPSTANAQPTLWLDIAGTYEVELVVYDELGMASCESAIVRINAVPEDDVHIQLTWTIPNVPNPQANMRGTDLDLHYLSSTGTWGSMDGSSIWYNYKVGRVGTQLAGASLDIDDLYGVAPENINHNDPGQGLAYSVGVHYYNANGNGASLATVRYYLSQQLVYEYRDKPLTQAKQFWYVGGIVWNTPPTVFVRDEILSIPTLR